MTVDQGFAGWLKAEALFVNAAASDASRWPSGKQLTVMTPIALRADAVAESERIAAFHGGPKVSDKLVVPGRRCDLVGKAVAASGDRLGYGSAPIVFVIGATEQPDDTTVLTVIRRL